MKEFKSKPVKGIDSLDEYSLYNVIQSEKGKLGAAALHSKYSKEQIEEWASNAGKVGGKVTGKMNVESGHWQKLASMGGKVAGKINGKKNVESGHLDRIREAQKKAVLQFDKDGNFIKEYQSQGDAARENGLKQNKISEVCSGNRKSTGGFVWKYKDE